MKTITYQNLNSISGGNNEKFKQLTTLVCEKVTALFIDNFRCENNITTIQGSFEDYNQFYTKYCSLEDVRIDLPAGFSIQLNQC